MTSELKNEKGFNIKFRTGQGILDIVKDIWTRNIMYFAVIALVIASWLCVLQPMYVISSNALGDAYSLSFTVADLLKLGGFKYADVFLMVLFFATVIISIIPIIVHCKLKGAYLVPAILTSIMIVGYLLYLVTHVNGLIETVNELKILAIEINRTPYLIALTVTTELTAVTGIYTGSDLG